MTIGLIDVDGHAAKKRWGATVYPNIALAKIARYHRQRGDEVDWAITWRHYDILYMSKVFNFSPDDGYCYDADSIVRGGTGYDIASRLPAEIDRLQPDYSIYPNVPQDTAYGFLTRGCPNHCPWCVVPRKEGAIRPYMDVDEIAIDGRRNLVLMDNNILAAGDYARDQLLKVISRGYRIDFNQAMDARLVDDEWAALLSKCKWIHSRIRFGCDTTAQIAHCERAIDLLVRHGFHGEFFLYTMVGGKGATFAEAYDRINHWRQRLKDARKRHQGPFIYPYAQPYRDPDNPAAAPPMWQRDLASWCNKKQLFWAVDFADFQPRKGFTCNFYLTNNQQQ